MSTAGRSFDNEKYLLNFSRGNNFLLLEISISMIAMIAMIEMIIDKAMLLARELYAQGVVNY